MAEVPPPATRAGLLRADRHVVPFVGRTEEYAELREWCRDGKASVRLLVGAGGVGKTRLALQLGRYLESVGWSVTVVGADREAEALTALRAVTSRSVLLIVDYAETRTGLVELLRSVANHPGHVRILLIARSVGDWWEQLGADVAAVRDLVRAHDPITLQAQVDYSRDSAALVREAVPHFAAALGVPVPSHIDVTVPDDVPPLLVLHAAALLAVLRSQDQPTASGQLVAGLDVLDELLGHERRYWIHSASGMGLGHLSAVVLQRAVAVACLFGVTGENETTEILRRVPELHDDEYLHRQVAHWLAELYPATGGYGGPLQPELIAEAHVIDQLSECPQLATAGLAELSEAQTVQMLTVLSLGAAHRRSGTTLLEQVLRTDIERLLFPALRVATTTGGALGAVLARILDETPLTQPTLIEVARVIPHPTTALADAAAVVTRRIHDSLPADSDPDQLADWDERLAVALAQVGRPEQALTHMRNAVRRYTTLAETDHDRFFPALARALHSLGFRYATQRDLASATKYTQQAINHYRTLAANTPDTYRPDLAACLTNLGIWLEEMGRHTEARPPLQEAVEIYQALEHGNHDRYLGELGKALAALARCTSKVPLEPTDAMENVVARNRELAGSDHDRHLPELTQALHNLGNHYAYLNRHTEALPLLAEATAHYRSLASTSPDRYRPDLASCLNDLGMELNGLDRRADALLAVSEALTLYQELAEASPQRYRADLATSLDCLVLVMSKMAFFSELSPLQVLPHAEEAISLYRNLTEIEKDVERYRAGLARSLVNLSWNLTELARHPEALPAAQEAVEIYQELFRTHQERYRQSLSRALRNLAVDLSGLSRHAEADRCRQEADRICPAHVAVVRRHRLRRMRRGRSENGATPSD